MKDKKEKKKKSHKDDKRSERKIQKKAKKKEKKIREKRLKKEMKSAKKIETIVSKPEIASAVAVHPNDDEEDCGPSIDLMNRAKCPETKEQWDKKQSHIRRVVDPETGRTRLIKGDGEILEEIVTKERHAQINKEATRSDGQQYQRNTIGAARKFR